MLVNNNAIVGFATLASQSTNATRFANRATPPAPPHPNVQPVSAERAAAPTSIYGESGVYTPCVVEFRRRNRRDAQGESWVSEGSVTLEWREDLRELVQEGRVVRFRTAPVVGALPAYALTNLQEDPKVLPGEPTTVTCDLRGVSDSNLEWIE